MSIIKVLRERTKPITVAELAKLLSVAEGTVQRWVRRRQIPVIRIGDVIRFDGTLLANWIEVQAACPFPPRAPENPDADPLHWQDLGELVPKGPVIRQQKESE